MKDELVKAALEEAQEHYRLVGVPATLRELFYRLASLDALKKLLKM